MLAGLGNVATRAPTLQFDVWYLVAMEGAANLDDPAFAAIRSTLEQIAKVDGVKRFELRQRKLLRTQSGTDAEAPPLLGVRNARLLKRADGAEVIAAEIRLGEEVSFNSSMKAQIELVPGERLVIGQTTEHRGDRIETLYQILRVSL